MVAEKAGIPSVTVAATSFLSLARQVAAAEGLPYLRVAEYPGTISIESDDEIREKFERTTFRQIVEALTEPLQSSTGPTSTASRQEESVFTGTLEEVNEFFFTSKWTDGLPVIPPSLEKVENYLKYSGYPADEQIAVLQPGNLRATPRGIAANAVMAGCRPEHMPLLIAAVQAIADPNYDLEQIGTTAGLVPFLIVNGPIIRQLGLEYGAGLISRGPNAAIGRALGLVIRNIAGLRPAEQQMGTFGYVLPFVLAEDQDGSPWESFHEERGFDRNTSTVTAGGTFNWGGQVFPSGTDPQGLLRALCYQVVKEVGLMLSATFGHLQMMTVVINPSVAEAIARGGYTKQAVKDYLFHNSRATIGEVNFESKYADPGGGGTTIRQLIERRRDTPKDWVDLGRPGDTVPVMAYPGLIDVVVCGDRTRNKAMALHAVYTRPTIKEIKLPPNWTELFAGLAH